MKAAVIGCGVMGSIHARIYHELGILQGVYDTDIDKSNELANKYYTTQYLNLDALLSSVNVATIAVPTPCHLLIGDQCLRKGVDILVEKPVSDTLESAKQLVNLASKLNRILAVGYIERFNPAVQALQTLVFQKFFGDITCINTKRVGGIPRSANNIILDLMTHDLNILISLFGKAPEQIWTHKLRHGNIVDSAQVLLDFGEASATCEANWISPIKVRRIEVTGTEGYATVDLINQSVTEIKQNLEVTHRYQGEPLKKEIEAFLSAVKTRSTMGIISGEDALRTLEVTLRAYKGE